MQGTVLAIRPGWRAASSHDTAARATIRQARAQGRVGLGVLGCAGRACWGAQGGGRECGMGAGVLGGTGAGAGRRSARARGSRRD